jgi:putative copper resistance protein D
MGYVAVAFIALTGAINSFLLVGRLGAMFGTPYGWLLAFKILLFLALVIVALINRFLLAPRVSDDVVALNSLYRAVGVEQGLGLCILAVVSVLGTWPPAIQGGQGTQAKPISHHAFVANDSDPKIASFALHTTPGG